MSKNTVDVVELGLSGFSFQWGDDFSLGLFLSVDQNLNQGIDAILNRGHDIFKFKLILSVGFLDYIKSIEYE